MKEDKLSILEELLDESLQEKKGIDDVIQKNLNRIAEIDSFINSIKNNEETDFKVFSPRSAESIHREELAKVEEEKIQLENSNDYYYKKLGKAYEQIRIINHDFREHVRTLIALIDEDIEKAKQYIKSMKLVSEKTKSERTRCLLPR